MPLPSLPVVTYKAALFVDRIVTDRLVAAWNGAALRLGYAGKSSSVGSMRGMSQETSCWWTGWGT